MTFKGLSDKRFLWIVAALVILLQLLYPILFPIVGHDSTVHLNWLYQVPKLFQQGYFYPRWMPESNWGFGAPSFYFYSPLVYWIASSISLLYSFSEIQLFHILALLFTAISATTGYLYLRSIATTKIGAFIGTVIYVAAPY